MTQFPTSAEEFYRLRDDRTDRCSGNREYQRVACIVRLSPSAASTLAGQTMFVVVLNLLSRWCRTVGIVAPRTSVHLALQMGKSELGDLVLVQMRDADPFGDFRCVDSGDFKDSIILSIGSDPQIGATSNGVFIDAAGWLASVSTRRPIP